jgi:hypothetical protein
MAQTALEIAIGNLTTLLNGVTQRLTGIPGSFFVEQIKGTTDLTGALRALDVESSNISKNFLLGRERINEFKSAIADTAPTIRRFGGDINDITTIINEYSQAVGRVVVFDPETYKDIFLLTDLLGKSASNLTTNFGDVGISITNVKGDIEESIKYIKSIGMDAKTVMGKVVDTTELLNRFNFKEGVLGFSKMAATASMLKMDMQSVKNFADKVFSPEGAIETAAALQRLGVFAGDLADPFSLMNKSVNGPEGLMMSIAELGERFVEMDSETKKFGINPSAMGMFKELATIFGTSEEILKKNAIALAEFNARASEIDLKFNLKDEDKMLIANLAFLDKKGEYVINVRDEQGKTSLKKVSDLSEEQIELLKKQQEKPETLETIARDSMSITKAIANDLVAIKYKILYGFVGGQGSFDLQEGLRTEASELFGKMYDDIVDMQTQRAAVNGLNFTELAKANLSTAENLIDTFLEIFQKLSAKLPANMDLPFAEGGLVYGPTRALVGDNVNASSDPEVIAPLSKLQPIMYEMSMNNAIDYQLLSNMLKSTNAPTMEKEKSREDRFHLDIIIKNEKGQQIGSMAETLIRRAEENKVNKIMNISDMNIG